MVDIKDYYHAALHDQMCHWFCSSNETLYVDIESALAPVEDLHLLLLADIWTPVSLDDLPPTIRASLTAWRSLHHSLKHSSLNAEVKVPIKIFKIFLPHLNHSDWSRYNLRWVLDLYEQGKLKSIKNLQKEYSTICPKLTPFIYLAYVTIYWPSPFQTVSIHAGVWNFYI